MQLSKWSRAITGFALPERACSTSAASTNFTRNSIESKFATTISSRRHRSGFAIDDRRPDPDPLQWPAWTAYHADAGEPTPAMTGSTTTGMKSYVPSSRSIASSREHTNVEPRIFTRADSLACFLPLGYVHAGIRFANPVDHAMPQREVVEERPQVAHQLEDAESEDEERHQDRSKEYEGAGGQHLEHSEDQDENQQDQSSGRAVDRPHRQQQDDNGHKQEEGESGWAAEGRGREHNEEEVEQEPHGHKPTHVTERLANLRRLSVDRLREVEDRRDGIFHGARIRRHFLAVHD